LMRLKKNRQEKITPLILMVEAGLFILSILFAG